MIAGSSCLSDPAAELRGLAKTGQPGFAPFRVQFGKAVFRHEDFAAHFEEPRGITFQLLRDASESCGCFA